MPQLIPCWMRHCGQLPCSGRSLRASQTRSVWGVASSPSRASENPPLFVAKEGWNPGCIFPLVPSSASCNSNWLPKSGNGVCVRTSPLLRHARPCSELRTNELSLSGILAGHVSERWPGIPRQPIVILFPKYCVRSTKHCLRSPEYSSSYLIPLVHFWNFTTTRSRQAGYRMSKSTNLDKKAVAPSTSYPAALGRTRTSSHWLVDGASWEGYPRGRALFCVRAGVTQRAPSPAWCCLSPRCFLHLRPVLWWV
jgi:hypothetical protein